MNLLSIRQQFCKLSGRYDLASTTTVEFDTDSGADFFINAGMRFLDRKYQTQKSVASYFEEIAIGSWYLTLQRCFAIQEVWMNDTESRWKLTKYPYQQIKETYTGLVSMTEGGPPLYYAPVQLRSVQVFDFQSLGAFFNYVESSDDGTFNGIIFTPKTDVLHNVEVIGRFYHADMENNLDQNFWTNEAPEVLLKGALYQLEVFYRNSEGANDWLRAIELDGMELEKNLVEEEGNDTRVIE